MSKKSLPDSLELLLDTMCNTFGGIMFIAISLILISQMVSNKIQSEADKTASEYKDLDPVALKRDIQDLEVDILKMQQKMGNLKSISENFTESREKKRKEYVAVLDEIKAKNDQLAALKRNLEELQNTNRSKAEQLKKSMSELEKQVENLEQRRDELKAQIKSEQAKVDALADTLKHTSGKSMTFAKEGQTDLSPYFVFFKDNTFYRFGDQQDPVSGEVNKVTLSKNSLRLIPIAGTGIRLDNVRYERSLEYALRDVSKHRYFFFISADENSFEALVNFRRYCRKMEFKSHLTYNPQGIFSVGKVDSYSASQ